MGIRTRADLKAAGAVTAYLLVRQAGHRPSLNLLWALDAGLSGIPWTALTAERKAQLRAELADAGD